MRLELGCVNILTYKTSSLCPFSRCAAPCVNIDTCVSALVPSAAREKHTQTPARAHTHTHTLYILLLSFIFYIFILFIYFLVFIKYELPDLLFQQHGFITLLLSAHAHGHAHAVSIWRLSFLPAQVVTSCFRTRNIVTSGKRYPRNAHAHVVERRLRSLRNGNSIRDSCPLSVRLHQNMPPCRQR